MNPQDASSRPAAEATAPPRKWSFFPHPVAWVVLGISLLASLGGWYFAWQHEELAARTRLDQEARRVAAALSERMQVYEDVLHGAAGLYAASTSVERGEWRAYLESVSIEKRFPGIDGVGFIAWVPRDELERFVQTTRADKTPGFEVKHSGSGEDLLVVKYIEPEARHGALLGRDVGTDPEQRAVAERARDTGLAALSGRVLLREDSRGPQPGCLMMLPVYRNGRATGTLAERRAAIEGWVFARFVTRQLMAEVLRDEHPGLRLQIWDVPADGPRDLIFDNGPAPAGDRAGATPGFRSTIAVEFGGRAWELQFQVRPSFREARQHRSSLWVGATGALISLLLFSIAWSLSHTRERALAIAASRTRTLREINDRLEEEIRERQRSEAALRHSEAIYHSLVETLPLGIVRKDADGRIVFANQRFCAEMGQALETLRGKTDADLFPPALAAQQQGADRQVLETGATVEAVEERPAPGGGVRYVQAIRTPVYDGGQTVIGVLGIFWDVTDKRRAEAELEHERFILRTLMDNVPERIYFKDRQSRFLRNSKAHLRVFGLTRPEEAIGKSDFDFFSEEHAREAFEDEQRLMATGEAITKEEKETWPDGSVTWALSTKMPLRDEHGNIVGTFGLSRDITDRKRAEEALRLAKEAAEEASRTKSQFLASMSHELRTPLNSVIGFANILLKNKSGNLSPTELNFLDRIQANGRHLLSLINQILDLSKIEARKVELQPGLVALDELVRETLAQQEGLVRDKPVQLVADLPPRVTPIVTDAEKLRQVIINLIGNALKFTEQGSVTVRVVTRPHDGVPTRIEVADTGIGIAKDKLGVIFEAFQQAEAGTARKYGGTGLGLTISQALCELMGYRIEVTSEPGRGSTFSVVLQPQPGPTAPGTAPGSAADRRTPAQGAVPSRRGALVLVIDDEPDSRTLLKHAIEDYGCQAVTASSGEEGLRLARELRPQLVTVDLMMPQMDGWAVIRQLKADPQLCNIPVVVASIVAAENRGRILGVVEVLQKPVDRAALLAVLRRCLPGNHPRILIVDDEEDARRVLASHLEDEPCEVRTAADGQQALEILEAWPPDLVLLDLVMPRLDGIAFLHHLRATARFQFLPVVIVTARELTVAEGQQLRQMAQDIVKKGSDFEADLRRVLRRLLPPSSPGGEDPP